MRPGERPHRAVADGDAVAAHLRFADRLNAPSILIHAREPAVAGERPNARIAGGQAGGAHVHPLVLTTLGRKAGNAVVPANPQRPARGEQVVRAAPSRVAVPDALRAGDRAGPRVDPHEERQVVLDHPHAGLGGRDQARGEAIPHPVVAGGAGARHH